MENYLSLSQKDSRREEESEVSSSFLFFVFSPFFPVEKSVIFLGDDLLLYVEFLLYGESGDPSVGA